MVAIFTTREQEHTDVHFPTIIAGVGIFLAKNGGKPKGGKF